MIDSLIQDLPENSRFQTIDYLPYDSTIHHNSTPNVILLPPSLAKVAVVREAASEVRLVEQGDETLTLLSIPATDFSDEQALSRVRGWLDQPIERETCWGGQPGLMLNLQHVKVFWSPSRIAVIAAEDQLQTACRSIIEVNFFVRELKAIEQAIITQWSHLETDTLLAFEFAEQDRHNQQQLRQRFQNAISLRARLARVTPYLLAPHVYPPTLASQVGERLRERIRVHEQVEFVSDQLEVFENVYGMCGQRSSDFRHARTGHTLEWIIIVLLAAEVILLTFEYLSAAGV